MPEIYTTICITITKDNMNKIFLMGLLLFASIGSKAANDSTDNDTVKIQQTKEKPVHFIRTPREEDEVIFESNRQRNIIFVNDQVTTHVVMPENIKLVDISTDLLAGDQCADNIVRIKPTRRMLDHELVGTITVIGERSMAQMTVVFTKGPALAHASYFISQEEAKPYKNPEVTMTKEQMNHIAMEIYTRDRQFKNNHVKKYGMKAVVNNIYTMNDYFFIDFSLYNKTKIKFDIESIRVKLTDKKETKATNSQTVELTPDFSLNKATAFKKNYRNVICVKKLTFPEEKILRLEVAEEQISGRTITIPINYEDILNADAFDLNTK